MCPKLAAISKPHTDARRRAAAICGIVFVGCAFQAEQTTNVLFLPRLDILEALLRDMPGLGAI